MKQLIGHRVAHAPKDPCTNGISNFHGGAIITFSIIGDEMRSVWFGDELSS